MTIAAVAAVPEDDISKRRARGQFVVRAGDLMQVGDDLRLAIRIAKLALDLAPQGATTTALRRMLKTLKGEP